MYGFLRWLLIACCLAGCTQNTAPAAASSHNTASSAASAPSGTTPAAAVQAYLDPVTGEWREPTTQELAAIESARKQAASASSQSSVIITKLADGVTQYDFGAHARINETACLDAKGQLGGCTAAQRAELEQGQPKP